MSMYVTTAMGVFSQVPTERAVCSGGHPLAQGSGIKWNKHPGTAVVQHLPVYGAVLPPAPLSRPLPPPLAPPSPVPVPPSSPQKISPSRAGGRRLTRMGRVCASAANKAALDCSSRASSRSTAPISFAAAPSAVQTRHEAADLVATSTRLLLPPRGGMGACSRTTKQPSNQPQMSTQAGNDDLRENDATIYFHNNTAVYCRCTAVCAIEEKQMPQFIPTILLLYYCAVLHRCVYAARLSGDGVFLFYLTGWR